ncbi:thermonuclease family protein [Sphingomonas flavalba]|uniref:thermonuclease family protein n=1 Tax=Sphingomonas flavalba TaxID=2559804 RepID=UPI0039E1F1B9
MLAIGAAAMVVAAAPPSRTTGRIANVTDGDTFRLTSGERIHIAGIDAAETQPGNANFARELAIGAAAKRRAIALLDGRTVAFERVGCSYNRTVARVWIGHRDLAVTLVDAGIARWWSRGEPKPDWCG